MNYVQGDRRESDGLKKKKVLCRFSTSNGFIFPN